MLISDGNGDFTMRIGLSTCGKSIGDELFEQYAKSGISCAEIVFGYEAAKTFDYKAAERSAKNYGIELRSLHLPFAPFEILDISSRDKAEYTVRYSSDIITKGADIGVKTFVIHPSAEPVPTEGDVRKERFECAKESLFALAEHAAKYDAFVAVEDLPRTCLGRNSDEILELVSAHDRLRVCFDTNHLLAESIPDFVKKVGNKIITTHVSDYDFVNERHWLPGEGKIDWQALLSALREVGYDGPFLYELSFNCPNTIIRDRALTCEDFARNARELFEGKEPTVISKLKPNLGMWE